MLLVGGPVLAVWSLLGVSRASALARPAVALKRTFEPKADNVLCDPLTKGDLRCERRYFDGRVRRRWFSEEATEYAERSGGTFVDLVGPKRAPSLDVFTDYVRDVAQKTQADRVKVETFRSPLTAFLYERGWRDSFKRSGFPGIDEEFREVQAFFGDALKKEPDGLFGGVFATTKTVVDLSCGTGLMARRLAGALDTEGVRLIAADYSEAMLLETARRFDDASSKTNEGTARPELVRVDVGALPFKNGSIAAVHAGAALHCWPDAERGLREVRRSLKSGGKFFATTFLNGALGSDRAAYDGFRFFTLAELDRMMRDAGFVDVDVRREGSYCAIIKCAAPDLFAPSTPPPPPPPPPPSKKAASATPPVVAVEEDTNADDADDSI